MAVFEKVQEIIVEELGKDASEVTLESTFDDLDADSLDLFQVISEIEDAFDIMMDTEDIIDLSSFEKGREILSKNYDIEF